MGFIDISAEYGAAIFTEFLTSSIANFSDINGGLNNKYVLNSTFSFFNNCAASMNFF